jgi:hypothetical protein
VTAREEAQRERPCRDTRGEGQWAAQRHWRCPDGRAAAVELKGFEQEEECAIHGAEK